jgi:outer membrane protein TolC
MSSVFTRRLPFLRASRRLALLSVVLSATGWSAEPEPLPDNAAAKAGYDLAEYERQIAAMRARPKSFSKDKTPAKIPTDFAPWWIRGQRASIGDNGGARTFSVEELYQRALQHSKQIRVFSDLPLIRETGIQEAKGAFDTNTFLQGKFGHANDPVGNVLTTGGASRFKQDQWDFEVGAKKKFVTGTEVTLSQKAGNTDNNSIYFTPNPQSTANLSLSVVQPLLRGAGVSYNRSIMRVAKIDSQVAMSEFIRQSESHLLEITRTYWALYAARVMYLQKAKLVEETGRVADEMRARQEVDARKTQLFRAQSALASRRSDLIRSEAAVRNAQDRLRALTSDPELLDAPESELIPADRLILSSAPVDAQQAAQAALRNRPEITQAFLQLQAASIRENMARNELMPELNLVLEGSLGGLTGQDMGTAYGKQYNEGGPGYGIGFVFSFPLENSIGRAHLERRKLEMRQQLNQIKTTIDTVLLEVKVSAREVATAYRETQAKYEAVRAFTEDLESIQARRTIQDLRDEVQAANYLDTMLDAQDRRSDAEEEFIRAAANYQIAVVNLERAKGNLLVYSDVTVMRGTDEKKLPQLWLEKGAHSGKTTYDSKAAQ